MTQTVVPFRSNESISSMDSHCSIEMLCEFEIRRGEEVLEARGHMIPDNHPVNLAVFICIMVFIECTGFRLLEIAFPPTGYKVLPHFLDGPFDHLFRVHGFPRSQGVKNPFNGVVHQRTSHIHRL